MSAPEALIPLFSVVCIFGIPIIAILTKHQQRMAELMRENHQTAIDPRIDALQRDVAQLKDLMHQQTIALDRLSLPRPDAEIQERVRG